MNDFSHQQNVESVIDNSIREMEDYIACFSCNARSLNFEGETHKYLLSAPGCWAMYCEVLEREYTDFRYAQAHHFTVDAYACQHPGKPEVSQAMKSVGIHLSSLFMFFEKGMPQSQGGIFKQHFVQYNKKLDFIHRLDPPSNLGIVTVYDVWELQEAHHHFEKCEEWARSTWQAQTLAGLVYRQI